MGGNIRVGLRVVGVSVDSVEDSSELIFPLPKEAVEPPGVPWVENFVCVGWGNGGDDVALVDAALHIVAAPVVLHHIAFVLRKTENVPGDEHIEAPLVLDIMYGENGFDFAVKGVAAVERPEKNGNGSRLPVVAVNDVWDEALHMADALEHRP